MQTHNNQADTGIAPSAQQTHALALSLLMTICTRSLFEKSPKYRRQSSADKPPVARDHGQLHKARSIRVGFIEANGEPT